MNKTEHIKTEYVVYWLHIGKFRVNIYENYTIKKYGNPKTYAITSLTVQNKILFRKSEDCLYLHIYARILFYNAQCYRAGVVH